MKNKAAEQEGQGEKPENEMCICGHKRNSHVVLKDSGENELCMQDDCECDGFTPTPSQPSGTGEQHLMVQRYEGLISFYIGLLSRIYKANQLTAALQHEVWETLQCQPEEGQIAKMSEGEEGEKELTQQKVYDKDQFKKPENPFGESPSAGHRDSEEQHKWDEKIEFCKGFEKATLKWKPVIEGLRQTIAQQEQTIGELQSEKKEWKKQSLFLSQRNEEQERRIKDLEQKNGFQEFRIKELEKSIKK